MLFKFWLPGTLDKTHTRGGISYGKMSYRSYMPESEGKKNKSNENKCVGPNNKK